eukprot:1644602-Rhodomonas_salina.3
MEARRVRRGGPRERGAKGEGARSEERSESRGREGEGASDAGKGGWEGGGRGERGEGEEEAAWAVARALSTHRDHPYPPPCLARAALAEGEGEGEGEGTGERARWYRRVPQCLSSIPVTTTLPAAPECCSSGTPQGLRLRTASAGPGPARRGGAPAYQRCARHPSPSSSSSSSSSSSWPGHDARCGRSELELELVTHCRAPGATASAGAAHEKGKSGAKLETAWEPRKGGRKGGTRRADVRAHGGAGGGARSGEGGLKGGSQWGWNRRRQ